ncbi:MAG: hypothetical protein JRC86_02990 [Deltaproteobacteria bacterium]|nr:hypothetical protein [Deltaproteobacteria bacterium]
MVAIAYTPAIGLDLLGDELGAWINDTDETTDMGTNSNDLTENGTVTTSVVATNSELLAAANFNGSNNLSLAYDAAFDFGTGNFALMGWGEFASASGDALVGSKGAVGATGFGAWYFASGNLLKFQVGSGATVTATHDPVAAPGYHHLAFVRRSGVLYIYLDGDQVASLANTSSASVSASLFLGGGGWYSSAGHQLSLMRLLGYAPDAARIKTIYNTEEILFRPDRVFTTVNVLEEFDMPVTRVDPSQTTVKHVQEAIGGGRNTLVDRRDDFWDINSRLETGIVLDRYQRFLTSAHRGGIFTLDELGTVAAPYDPRSCYIEGNNYQRSRSGDSNYYTFSFRARET